MLAFFKVSRPACAASSSMPTYPRSSAACSSGIKRPQPIDPQVSRMARPLSSSDPRAIGGATWDRLFQGSGYVAQHRLRNDPISIA